MGSIAPIDNAWRSPFVGKSIADAAKFIRNAPKPPKALCKRLFAVLQSDFYEKSGIVLVCRISPGDVEDEIEGDCTKEEGVQSFKNVGRSLICRVVSDGKQRSVVDDGVSHVTRDTRVDRRDRFDGYCRTHDHFRGSENYLGNFLLRPHYPEFVLLLEEQFVMSIWAVTADDQTEKCQKFLKRYLLNNWRLDNLTDSRPYGKTFSTWRLHVCTTCSAFGALGGAMTVTSKRQSRSQGTWHGLPARAHSASPWQRY